MKKLGIYLLILCLFCGCSVVDEHTEPIDDNSKIVNEEVMTLIEGVIVEITENGFHMETIENKLMSVTFNTAKSQEYKVGDFAAITLQREIPSIRRYCAIEEGDTVDIIIQSVLNIVVNETPYLDLGKFEYTLINTSDKPVYVSPFKIYESGTGDLQINNHVSDIRVLVEDEYQGMADLSGYTALTSGKYYLIADAYDQIDSEIPIGQAALPIEIDSEVIADRMCTIDAITSDYFIAKPFFYDVQEESDAELRFLVDLNGQISEGTGAEYTIGDNIKVVYDKRNKIYNEEGYYEITLISYEGLEPLGRGAALKPVIYLYPETETKFTVTLDYDGKLTTTYPTYKHGWQGIAKPDGTLYVEGKEYTYLYWEGVDNNVYDLSKGFVVKGEDSAEFLQDTLAKMGLLPKEYNEFIVFWLPYLEKNPYNLITFQQEAYTNHAVLHIEPEPDSMLRVFMVFQSLDTPIEIDEMEIKPFKREGFTVIEWGGSEIKSKN